MALLSECIAVSGLVWTSMDHDSQRQEQFKSYIETIIPLP